MKDALKFLAILAVILCALFWRSFLPDEIGFSNDGPLGVMHWIYAQTFPPDANGVLMKIGCAMVAVWYIGFFWFFLREKK